MRTLLATLAIIALSSGAQAYCYPVPESDRNGYQGNDLKRTICLQQELAQSTETRAIRAQLDAMLSKIQRDLQQQKLMQQQLQLELMKPSTLLP